MASGRNRTQARTGGHRKQKLLGAAASPIAALAQGIAAKGRIARRLERSGHSRSAVRGYLRLVEDCRDVVRLATLELGTSFCRAGNAAIRAGRGEQGAALLKLGLWYVRRATGDLVPDTRAAFSRKLAKAHALAESASRV
jgi:hypothetical protein